MESKELSESFADCKWQRADDWSENNRSYTSPGYIASEISDWRASGRRLKYEAKMNVLVVLCEPETHCEVIKRRIDEIRIERIAKCEYRGGIEEWVKNKSLEEFDELVKMSALEVGGGLIPCEKLCTYEVYDKKESVVDQDGIK